MRVRTAAAVDRSAIGRAFDDPSALVVIALCAAWCDTCREFREACERLARARPQVTFVWLDIEDDAALAGEVDIENFPTLAIYRGRVPVHFGISLPQEGTVGRLIDALADSGAALAGAPEAVIALADAFVPY